MKKVQEPPKIFHIGGWTAAVIAAAVFAVACGIFVYQKISLPIQAATQTGSNSEQSAPASANREECTNVALNNYPEANTISSVEAQYKHGEFEDKMGGYWRCNVYCVPGVESNNYTSTKSQQSIKTFLSGKTMGGQAVNVVNTGSDFKNILGKPDGGSTMAHTVILDASKQDCVGYEKGKGSSINYDQMADANGTTYQPSKPNLTAEDAKAYQEEMAKQEAAKQTPAEAVEESVSIPGGKSGSVAGARSISQNQDGQSSTVTGEDGSKTTVLNPKTNKDEFVRCMKVVNDHLTNRSWLAKLLGKEKDYLKSYSDLKAKTGYPDEGAMSSKIPAASDVEKARKDCFALSDKINTQYKLAVEAATAAGSQDQVVATETTAAQKIQNAQNVRLVITGRMLFSEKVPYITNETLVGAKVGGKYIGRTKITKANGYFNASDPTRYLISIDVEKGWLVDVMKTSAEIVLVGQNSGGIAYASRVAAKSYSLLKQNPVVSTTGNTATVLVDLGKVSLSSAASIPFNELYYLRTLL